MLHNLSMCYFRIDLLRYLVHSFFPLWQQILHIRANTKNIVFLCNWHAIWNVAVYWKPFENYSYKKHEWIIICKPWAIIEQNVFFFTNARMVKHASGQFYPGKLLLYQILNSELLLRLRDALLCYRILQNTNSIMINAIFKLECPFID